MRKLQSVALALFCLTLVGVICGASVVSAQEVTATITGTITDQSSAAVAEANVTATSVERGVAYTATTNDAGIYRISNLPVGNYDLKVEKTGFQTALRQFFRGVARDHASAEDDVFARIHRRELQADCSLFSVKIGESAIEQFS